MTRAAPPGDGAVPGDGAAPTVDRPAGATAWWRTAVRPVAGSVVAARGLVAAGFVLAHLAADRVRLPDGRLHLREGLLTWDGTYYRVLAETGYATGVDDAGRFFPLYPALSRLVAPVLGGRTDLALLVVANLAAVGAALVLWRLVAVVVGPDRTADRAVWALALWPSAYVLAFAYSEGMFVLAVAGSLLLLHRRSFALAGVAGMAAALVRPVGVLVALPALVEVVRAWQGRGGDDQPPPRVAGSVLAVLGPPAGTAVALWWIAAASGDAWTAPFTVQRQLRAGFAEPVTRLGRAVVEVAGGDLRDLPNLVMAVLGVALLVVAVRRRQPLSWTLYSAATLAVVLAAENIDSLGRYLLGAVPLLVAAAQWADRPWRARLAAAVGGAGLAAGTAVALWGRIVP